jgi:LPS export ABC transporter protein LptC
MSPQYGFPIRSLLFAVVAAAAVLVAYGCRPEEEPAAPPAKNLPTQVIDDFTLTETSGEHVSWRLKAKRADIYEDANEARIYDVNVDFYEEGVYSSNLTSREGRVDTLRHNMQAKGNVVLVSRKDGAVLKTEELNWDADGSRIYSDKYCVLERGKSLIRGQGFNATPGLDSFSTHQLNADVRESEMEGMDPHRPKGTAAPTAGKTAEKGAPK